jgi:hypothetical protein
MNIQALDHDKDIKWPKLSYHLTTVSMLIICFLFNIITNFTGDNIALIQVSLLEPPLGEGGSYSAKFKDLRPALDWSIIEGWTVPRSQVSFKW